MSGEWPVQRVRNLTSDERVELRTALVVRGSALADLLAKGEDERLQASKDAVDGLLREVDDVRVEVTS